MAKLENQVYASGMSFWLASTVPPHFYFLFSYHDKVCLKFLGEIWFRLSRNVDIDKLVASQFIDSNLVASQFIDSNCYTKLDIYHIHMTYVENQVSKESGRAFPKFHQKNSLLYHYPYCENCAITKSTTAMTSFMIILATYLHMFFHLYEGSNHPYSHKKTLQERCNISADNCANFQHTHQYLK